MEIFTCILGFGQQALHRLYMFFLQSIGLMVMWWACDGVHTHIFHHLLELCGIVSLPDTRVSVHLTLGRWLACALFLVWLSSCPAWILLETKTNSLSLSGEKRFQIGRYQWQACSSHTSYRVEVAAKAKAKHHIQECSRQVSVQTEQGLRWSNRSLRFPMQMDLWVCNIIVLALVGNMTMKMPKGQWIKTSVVCYDSSVTDGHRQCHLPSFSQATCTLFQVTHKERLYKRQNTYKIVIIFPSSPHAINKFH